MGLILKRYAVFLSTLCLVLATSGCALSKKIDHIKLKRQQRAEALLSFEKQFKSYRTIGMVEADVSVNELLAGGEREPIEEWSSAVRKNLTDVVVKEFTKRSVTLKPVSFNKETGGELREAYWLYRAINANFREENDDYKKLSLCNDDFPCPDYAIGQIEGFLKKERVDLLLFIFAENEIETEARKQARETSKVTSVLSHVFAPPWRLGFSPLRKPGAFVGMTMIDKTGTVIWHGSDDEDMVDLRNPQAADKMAKEILEKLFRRE